ncbi:MAG TPA: hypothetical protein VGP25_14770 [Gemmatimonadaceae bacterium]|jgi:hypothetical protein|nr:hypothetical protein [Gemmatimonadaceae bacterium]
MRRFEIGLVVAALLLVSGCGGPRASERGPRPDPRIITREQMLERHFLTAMEAVQSLKANWITPRGPDSFTVPSQLWVYFDNVRLGSSASLRTINTRDISYLQYFNGIEATSRWGVGHGAGVILAVSWPGGEPVGREPEEKAVVDSSDRAFDTAAPRTMSVSRHELHRPGAHASKLWMIDPGIVLQKLVVDDGGAKPSYLGPPESPRIPDGRVGP